MEARGKIVIVEGNISAGKSCLTRDLASIMKYRPFFEPTLKNPYLDHYYENPKKYGLPMQIWLLKQRFLTYVAAIKYWYETGNGVLLDRSVFSDVVFAVKNHIDGNISDEGFENYTKIRNDMLSFLPPPHVTLYLKVDPSICYNRVHSLRCRGCEVNIAKEYLCGLDTCYDDFLKGMEETGSTIVAQEWDDFGNSRTVARNISNAEFGVSTAWERCIDMIRHEKWDGLVEQCVKGFREGSCEDAKLITSGVLFCDDAVDSVPKEMDNSLDSDKMSEDSGDDDDDKSDSKGRRTARSECAPVSPMKC